MVEFSMNATNTPACLYRQLPNGYHEIMICEPTAEASKEFKRILDHIFAQTSSGAPAVRIIINALHMDAGSLTGYLKSLLSRYTCRPSTRIAIIVGAHNSHLCYQTVVNLSAHEDDISCFTNRSLAIGWLTPTMELKIPQQLLEHNPPARVQNDAPHYQEIDMEEEYTSPPMESRKPSKSTTSRPLLARLVAFFS
jgi:hypothetical protein